jgi:tryptophan-rich sensory protein
LAGNTRTTWYIKLRKPRHPKTYLFPIAWQPITVSRRI